MDALAQWFKDSWEAFVNFFKALLNTWFDMLKDFWFWVFEQVINLTMQLFNQITDGSSWDLAQYITALPSEVTQTLGALGFGNCMVVLGFALLVRFMLGLIPFVRVGR